MRNLHIVRRWSEVFFTERNLFWAFVSFLIIAAIVRIGYFPGRVMQYDQTISGPFIAHLLAYPHLYEGDLVSVLRPLGFVSLVPFVEGMLLLLAGLDPLITSYIFTVVGNVLFVLALFVYARLFLNNTHAMIAALMAYTLRIDTWSIALTGNLQVFPTATDLAAAVVIFAFTAVLRDKWIVAIALIALAGILHPVYALFAAIPCAFAAFFDTTATWRNILLRQTGFAVAALVAIAIPVIVMAVSERNQVSTDYFLPLFYGISGHASAWLNTEPFLKKLGLLIACIIGYAFFCPRQPKLITPLFWCTTLSVIAVSIAQWAGVAFQYSFSVPLAVIAAARCSVYVAWLAFPVIYRGIIVATLNRITPLHQIFRFVPYALLAAVFVITLIDCRHIGKESRSPLLLDEIAVSKWMRTTPPNTQFLVTERVFQQNSFALRPAAFPVPYLITTAYRIRDERAINFDREMVQFWGPPSEYGRQWLERYLPDIEDNRMQRMTEKEVLSLSEMFSAQYFITRKTASLLPWEVAHTSNYFVAYKIPKSSTTK